jgi:hypothetical protein
MPYTPVFSAKEASITLGVCRTCVIYHIKQRHISAEKIKEAGRLTWFIEADEIAKLKTYLRGKNERRYFRRKL